MAAGQSESRPPSSTRAVGYLRRSTDRQEQSIPDQKKAIEEYASGKGFQLVDLFIDDAISGTSTLGRKAFQEMIAQAQKNQLGSKAMSVVTQPQLALPRSLSQQLLYFRPLPQGQGAFREGGGGFRKNLGRRRSRSRSDVSSGSSGSRPTIAIQP